MTEEEYNEFCKKNLDFFAQLSSRRNEKYTVFHYAYIKLADGKKVLFRNINGKSLFRTKNALTSQINSRLSNGRYLVWEGDDKDKKRFVKEHVVIREIVVCNQITLEFDEKN